MGFSCISTSEQSKGTKVSTDQQPLRVMSFNIRYDNPDDGPDAWPNRKEFVGNVIRFHKADVIGVQEALSHQLDDLIEQLPDYEWTGIGRDEDGGGEFSAILYNTKRVSFLNGDTFWLSETPDIAGSIGWDAAITRVATYGHFEDVHSGRTFTVVNTHFDHVGVESRRNSAALIVQKLEELAGEKPLVVMGDLNTTEELEPYRELTTTEYMPGKTLLDGFYHSEYGHHGPTTTLNGFQEILPDRRIDYIFVNSEFRVLQHAILADIQDGHFPSDHLPVLAEMEFLD